MSPVAIAEHNRALSVYDGCAMKLQSSWHWSWVAEGVRFWSRRWLKSAAIYEQRVTWERERGRVYR